ncbi:FitA-like ribbon-helix-helix domain-containing protein [Thiolinea disciformis]|uniref:FitA-like ribbon-helix-helix domain-containing protein n=1 Tax=Thiolinea disciformis TaxID=125614 RepID=UPI003CCBD0E2
MRVHAARHNVSMEEEARRILRQAVSSSVRLGDLACQLFGKESGIELELPQHSAHVPLSF